MGHVHERCLLDWVSTQQASASFTGLPTCPNCKERYRGDIVFLFAAGFVLRLQLELPLPVQSRLVTELQRCGFKREATAMLRRASRSSVLVADPSHPETLRGLCTVASAMIEVRQWQAADMLLRRVLRSCEQHRRRSSGRFWQLVLGSLPAAAWEDEGEEEEALWAEYEWQYVRAISQDAADALAGALREQGRLEEAEQELSRHRALDREEWLSALALAVQQPLPLLCIITAGIALFACCWPLVQALRVRLLPWA